MGLLGGAGRSEVVAEPAERIVLKKFHPAGYLHALKTASKGKWEAAALDMGIGSPDCPVFGDMYDYSALACGATLKGVELILAGAADVAFNPSGGLHHSGPERASGFCYLNDVALACVVLAEQGKRVLYLDVDVHHGDGVANAFYGRADVLTISFHQNPRTLFPGTGFEYEIGTGEGKGYCVNVPLPAGTYDQAYMEAFRAVALPLIKVYDPDVIVCQLGADGLAGDPLANFYLSNNVYADVISCLLGFDKPIIGTGGGGYDVENTVRAWALDWCVLCGADAGAVNSLRDKEQVISGQQQNSVMPSVEAVIKAVRASVFGIHGL